MEHLQTDVRMRILLAAKTLFAQYGYDGTTVRQICEAADSNIALVSYYFGGKENVFFSLLEMFSPAKRFKLMEELTDPVHIVSGIIREMIEFKIYDPEMASILQQEFFMKSPRMEIICTYTLPVWIRLRDALEMGRAQGLFTFDSLDMITFFIIALNIFPANNPAFKPLLTEENIADSDIVESALHFILNGLNYRTTH